MSFSCGNIVTWNAGTASYRKITHANKQQAIMALFQLQSMGINEDQILDVNHHLQQMNNGQ